jgi:hypothetical protein
MPRMMSIVTALLTLVPASCAVLGDASPKPSSPATIELTVRGPDGRPLANRNVELLASTEYRLTTKTDGIGLARFPWPAEYAKILVKASGIGYGATGFFDSSPGETARPVLPRLVPFGVIEGTIPKELRKRSMTVRTGLDDWLHSETSIDGDGHFVLKDVAYGGGWLLAQAKEDKQPTAEAFVTFAPGQRVKEAAFVKTQSDPAAQMPSDQPEEKPKQPVVWAEGTVRDEAGDPIEGALVFAVAMRRLEFVPAPQALTDANGRWQITGEPGLQMAEGQLLVCKLGLCPEFASLRCPVQDEAEPAGAAKKDIQGTQPPRLKPPAYDIVLSRRRGAMEVRVTRNGKPLPDALVSLDDDDCVRSVALDEARRFLFPTAVTGDDGIARFADLMPGMYSITIGEPGRIDVGAVRRPNPRLALSRGAMSVSDSADTHGESAVAFWQGAFQGTPSPVPNYRGIVVEAGRTRNFHATIRAHKYPMRMNLRNPDGKPAAGLNAFFDGITGRETFDDNGFLVRHFETPGLHRFSLTYIEGKSEVSGDPDRQVFFKPYCHVDGEVAASDLLRTSSPLTFTSGRHKNIPGSLVVQLQDVSGQPAAGYVFVDRIHGTFLAASTDEKGEVRFEGVMPTEYGVEGVLPGLALPEFDAFNGPLPDDKVLLGRRKFFPEDVKCPLGTETRLVVRPKRVGYVRGVLQPAAGTSTEGFYSIEDFGVPKNGRFLIGPYVEGKKSLRLTYWSSSSRSVDCGAKEVTVRNDRVAQVEFEAPRIVVDPQSCGAEDGRTNQWQDPVRAIEGIVFRSDGHTPARGAHVAIAGNGSNRDGDESLSVPQEIAGFHLFGRASHVNSDERIADWQGRFLLFLGASQAAEQDMVSARMPGCNGPALAPAKNALTTDGLRIVPPPSVIQAGKVTVDGKQVSGFRGELHVMAAREGNDPFNRLFQQFVSADPEGSFEIPALSPGVYQIQAALDGIWLSESVRVSVAADDAPLKPIKLNIGAPGPPSSVTTIDSQDKPLADLKVNVVRPAGPLARLLWSRVFATDGAGVAHIPPLEAGRHAIQIQGVAAEHTITVPSLSDANPVPASLRVVVH